MAQQTVEEKRAAATAAFVEVAFDDAYRIREELYGDEENGIPGLYARRKANREQLRSLASQGHLSEDQRAELEELYPARAKTEEEAEGESEAGNES